MAGQSAGALYIEILAQTAKLQEDMRRVEKIVGGSTQRVSRDARAANDNLRNIGRGAGQGVQQFSRNVAQLKAQLDPAWAAAQRFKQQQLLLNQAFREGAISSKELVTQLRANAVAYQNAGKGVVQQTAQQRMGFQQLTYQMNDVGASYASGIKPMVIFAQQGGQVVQALSLMGSQGSKLTAFLTGPWGAALMGAVSILGILATSYFQAAGASDTKKDAAEDLTDALNELHKATVRESQSTWASIQTDIDKANSLRLRAIEARKAAIAELELAKARAEGAEQSISPGAPGYSNAFNLGEQAKQEANARTIQNRIEEQQALVKKANETIRLQRGQQAQLEVAAQFDTNAAATLKYDKALDGLNNQLRTGAISQAEYKQQLIAITAAREAEAESGRKSERSSRQRTARLTDEQKAVVQQTKATDRYIESLSDEIARIGLDDKALRQLEVTREMSAAQTVAEKNVIAALNVVRERAIALAEAEAQAKANKDAEREIARMKAELGLIGLVGDEREKMALAISEEAEVTAVLVKIKQAEADGNTALIAQLERQIELIQEKYNIERKGMNMSKAFEDEADAAKLLNDQLRDMVGLLGNLGGVGQALGGLLGIFTGNTSAIGGPLGDLFNTVIGSRTDEKTGKVIAKTIGDELTSVFGATGPFAKTMQGALQGAGTGVLAGQAFFGDQSTVEQIGSALGGAAGKALGTAVAGPVGGAVGSVLGGIAGGFIGGLFGGNKTARANITGANSVSIAGKDTGNYGTAGGLADSVLSGLESIADALGGTLGSFNTTIGVRGDEYRVNTSGTSLKLKNGAVGFGQDAEAAIAYAMADAVKDGALQGLRAGTQALLKKSGDFETQLQKALAFEGVFRDLEAASNPLSAGLAALATDFDALRAIFKEAGASAQEFGDLQEYMTRKQQALIDEISATYRNTFYTDAEKLTAAKSTISNTLSPMGYGSVNTVAEYKALVEATDALANPELYGTLMDLADEFGVLKDAADNAAEAAKAEAAARKALAAAIAAQKTQLQIDLLNAQGRSLEATAKQREAELAAMDTSLHALQKQVWATQDLAEAYERESSELDATIKTFGALGDTLRDFRQSLYQTDDATGAYARSLAELRRVGELASLGDQTAMGQLPGVGREFLEVAKGQASSLQDYQREVARVARYADSAIGSADGMVTEAERQLAVMNEQVSQFIQLNETALSIEQALSAMTAPIVQVQSTQDEPSEERVVERLDRVERWMERLATTSEAGALASIEMARTFKRVTRNGTELATTTEVA